MSSPNVESSVSETALHPETPAPERKAPPFATAFGCPRDSLNNRFVYLVVSARARGLSIGVNLNPDKHCNFDCVYCEVDREAPAREQRLDVDAMASELQETLSLVHTGRIRERGWYGSLPDELLQLRHVALSGVGEPTLCPNFAEVVQAVIHLRALAGFPFFKIVLITNATGADQPQVQQALSHFTKRDEIWAKLEAGTQAYMDKVNRASEPLDKVMANILALGRQRPVVIQSLFPLIHGEEPSLDEIDQYAKRLQDLIAGGAQISLVQVYSATRPAAHSECGHLPLKSLSRIAQTVKRATGLRVEVF